MKNCIITLLSLFISISAFSQHSKDEYVGRLTPSVKKEKLSEAKKLSDIIPDYPQDYYHTIIDYVSVEISTYSGDKVISSVNSADTLSAEEKNIVNSAESGNDICVKIRFKYKDQTHEIGSNRKIKEMEFKVTAVPETEAEYPGGYKQITQYLKDNVINKIPEKSPPEKIRQVIVSFTINEAGEIVDTKIFKSSTDPKTDQLLFDAINKMPKWKPAENSKGIKVKEEFKLSVPFYAGGC